MVGREKELQLLKDILIEQQCGIHYIVGRQGLGKSTLLKSVHEYCQQQNYRYSAFLYLPASPLTMTFNRNLLEDCINNALCNPDISEDQKDCLRSVYIGNNLMETLWNWIDDNSSDIILLIDDLDYLLSLDQQKVREWLEQVAQLSGKGRICVIATIRSIGVKEEQFTIRNGGTVIHLEPLLIDDMNTLLEPKPSFLKKMEIYGCVGANPKLVVLWDEKLSTEENLKRLYFNENAILKDEALNIFYGMFRKPTVYMLIINEIMNLGYGRAEKIKASINAMSSNYETVTNTTTYLATMVQDGLLNQVKPIDLGEYRGNAKITRYYISDPIILFWGRYSYYIGRNLTDQEFQGLYQDFRELYMNWVYVQCVRQHLKTCINYCLEINAHIKAGTQSILTVDDFEYGQWWSVQKAHTSRYEISSEYEENEIDVVAKYKNEIIFYAFCTADHNPLTQDQVEAKINSIPIQNIETKYYILISKSGYTKDCIEYLKKMGYYHFIIK